VAYLTRVEKYKRYRAAIAKIDEGKLTTPAEALILEPLPSENDGDHNGVSRATRALPLEEIIKGADVVAGKHSGPEIDAERIQTRHFVLKVVLVCLLAALFIVAIVIWIIQGGGL